MRKYWLSPLALILFSVITIADFLLGYYFIIVKGWSELLVLAVYGPFAFFYGIYLATYFENRNEAKTGAPVEERGDK